MDDIIKVMYIAFMLVPIKKKGDFSKQWGMLKSINFREKKVRIAATEFLKQYGTRQDLQQIYWLEILRDHYG